ncbi:MAG: hypothetical protein KAQ71_10855, partial [Desulfobulbaceae bacterium]|nr:hypothetical protein [Desulfobulbaceae bacterium]
SFFINNHFSAQRHPLLSFTFKNAIPSLIPLDHIADIPLLVPAPSPIWQKIKPERLIKAIREVIL